MTPAIVLSAGPTGLGALRTLSRAGIRTAVIAYSKTEMVCYSRYGQPRHLLPDHDKEKALLKILQQWPEPAVLIPTSDWFVDVLARNRASLDKFLFTVPDDRLSQILIDKRQEVVTVAPWVTVPKTLPQLPDRAQSLLEQLPLPILIKPRSPMHQHALGGRKNLMLDSDAAVHQFYADHASALDALIAQEIIPGDDDQLWVCNCTFDRQHQLVRAFTFQRLYTSPAHYGVTSFAISRHNPAIIEQVARLGQGLKYVGPAMIEFKYDSRDGCYKYIETNPRLGMCNAFDSACGQNNVIASYEVALGQSPAVCLRQQEGRVFISLFEDLYSRYKAGFPWRKTLRLYSRYLFCAHTFILFDWRDPLPALTFLWHKVRQTRWRR